MAKRKRPKKQEGREWLSPEEFAQRAAQSRRRPGIHIPDPKNFSENEARKLAAARRGRRPKGSSEGGEFTPSGRSVRPGSRGAAGSMKGKRTGGGPAAGPVGSAEGELGAPTERQALLSSFSPDEIMAISRQEARQQLVKAGVRGKDLDSLTEQYANSRFANVAGYYPSPAVRGSAPTRVSSLDIRAADQSRKESTWQTEEGVHTQPGAQRKGRSRQYIPPSQFVREEMSPSQQRWLEQALKDPRSEINKGVQTGTARLSDKDSLGRRAIRGRLSPGQRHKLETYTRAQQEGLSHEASLQLLRQERRGRPPTQKGRRQAAPTTVGGIPRDLVQQSLDKAPKPRRRKYESLTPNANEMGVGLSAQHASTIAELGEQFPQLTQRGLVALQTNQRMSIYDEFARNQRWAQETKAKREFHGGGENQKDPNRVVFFTTSYGKPAPSVPAQSLIGQYIIRRRKNMLRSEGIASGTALAGGFPDAVRDMHIVEAGSGVALGAEGNIGAYKRSGFRVGKRKSPNYGKPVPVGSSVMHDSQGRPVYDENGNLRFGQGYTRPFTAGLRKEVGFRVYVG